MRVYILRYLFLVSMVFGMVHPYIFIHFMKMFFVLVSLVFSIHCIHVCVEKEDWEMYVWCNLSKEAFQSKGRCV